MEQLKKKIYYRIAFSNVSPLSVGSGENNTTDKDIIRDKTGVPYIPATAIAGISRRCLDSDTADKYLGKRLRINEGNGEQETCETDASDGRNSKDENASEITESNLFFYDAILSGSYKTGRRDGVGLDEWKFAKPGAKFDYEILEPGAEFVTYIEQNVYDGDTDVAGEICSYLKSGEVSLGSKTSRGLGVIEIKELHKAEFDFGKQDSVEQWLEFDVYKKPSDEKAWNLVDNIEPKAAVDGLHIHLDLKLETTLMIRKYTTEIGSDQNPDYEQLAYHSGAQKTAVIPGTSWAGAFLHQMVKLDADCRTDYFGESEKQKSRITFSEQKMSDCRFKKYMRNSINRFTGGAKDRALFTEEFGYGGTVGLDIRLDKTAAEDKHFVKCLFHAILDLHYGFLPVGGETSVGRGIFSVTGIKVISKKEKEEAVVVAEYPLEKSQKTAIEDFMEECFNRLGWEEESVHGNV